MPLSVPRPTGLVVLVVLAVLTASATAAADGTATLDGTFSASDSRASFGKAVAVSGDTAVVAAPGSASDDVHDQLHVLARGATAWEVATTLELPSTGDWGYFTPGPFVAISGSTIVAGGPQSNEAYVFTGGGAVWSTPEVLSVPGAKSFGWSVALSGDTALVGAPGSQKAYVFVRGGGSTWTLQETLDAPDVSHDDDDVYAFGNSVALDGDTAVVGGRSGAYAYVRQGTQWSLQQRLLAKGVLSVALDCDTVAIGCNETLPRGSVFVLTRSGSTWTKQQELKAACGTYGDSVSLSGDVLVAGLDSADDACDVVRQARVFVRSFSSWSRAVVLEPVSEMPPASPRVAVSGHTVLLGYDELLPSSPGAAYTYELSGLLGDACAQGSDCVSDICTGGACCDAAGRCAPTTETTCGGVGGGVGTGGGGTGGAGAGGTGGAGAGGGGAAGGDAATDGSAGGCACRAAGGTSAGGVWAFAALALLAARRALQRVRRS